MMKKDCCVQLELKKQKILYSQNDIEKGKLILYLARNLAMSLSGVGTITAIFEELNINPNNYIPLIKKVATKIK